MKTSTSKRLRWNVAIWLAAGLFMTSASGMAAGPIMPDPKAEARHQPQVEETANGIPLVNITAPSSGGVSRNEYETFNVPDKGAILNNSYTLSKTELAGYVQGNNNMAERPAKIIVNEVTGAGSTSMDGFLEVAGNRADVVIANPNGITVNGGGFINTGKAFLTTGKPVYDGEDHLQRFDITGGDILIEGKGLGGKEAGSLAILSRAVKINAGIWAKDLHITTGANTVDAKTLEASAIEGKGGHPAFALDTAAIGGMYAGRITLVGTEKGLGVNNSGTWSAEDNLILDWNGDLKNSGTIYSKGNTDLRASRLENDKTIAAERNLSAAAKENIRNQGKLLAGENMDIYAGKTLDNAGHAMESGNNLSIETGDAVNNAAGTIKSGGSQQIKAGHTLTNTEGTLAADGNINIQTDKMTGDGIVSAGKKAGILLEKDFTNTGRLEAGSSLSLAVKGNITNRKEILSRGHLALESKNIRNEETGEIKGADTETVAENTWVNHGLVNGENVHIRANHITNENTGRIYGTRLSVETHTLDNLGTYKEKAPVIASREHMNLSVAGTLTNTEHALIRAEGNLTIGGQSDENGKITGKTEKIENRSAYLESGGNMTIGVNHLENRNEHFSTKNVLAGKTHHEEAVGQGKTDRFTLGGKGTEGAAYIERRGHVDHLYTPDGGDYDHFTTYIYDRSVYEDRIDTTDPAHIAAGGSLSLEAGRAVNDRSVMTAGKTLTIHGTDIENQDEKGHKTVKEEGAATSYWTKRVHHGVSLHKRTETRTTSAGYMPADAVTDTTVIAAVDKAHTNPVYEGTKAEAYLSPSERKPLHISDSSLYHITSDPTARYLVETDPAYADRKTFLSSDYFFRRMQYDPEKLEKRLGDGYYESQIVRDRLMQLKGKPAGETEYKALMDAAVRWAQENKDVRIGMALTEDQKAALKEDIVWMVESSVLLPDGNIVKALVPEVYLAHGKNGTLTGSALISAENIDIRATNDILSRGTVIAGDTMRLSASDINNEGGTIKASTLMEEALHTIRNTGTMEAENKLSLKAGQDIDLASTLHKERNQQGYTETIASSGKAAVTGNQGTLSIEAGRDITAEAAEISSAGNIAMKAGRDITMGTAAVKKDTTTTWDRNNYRHDSAARDIGASVTAKGSLTMQSERDISIKAADIRSEGMTAVEAGRNLTVENGKEITDLEEHHRHKERSLLSSTTTTTHDEVHAVQAQKSIIEGNTVSLQGGKDISLTGSAAASTKETTLSAGRNISIHAAEETNKEIHKKQVKKSGLIGSGLGFTIGSEKKKDAYDTEETMQRGSTVGSVKGNVTITAGQTASVRASDIIAGKDTLITGRNVDIESKDNTYRGKEEHEYKKSGLTVSLGGAVITAKDNIIRPIKNAGQVHDGLLGKLYAADAGFNLHDAAKTYKNIGDVKKGITLDVSLGTQSAKSDSRYQGTEAKESRIVSGGNIRIKSDENIAVKGSQITGENVTLQAGKDIHLTAAENRKTTEGNSRSKGAGITASFGIGGLQNVGISAGKSKGNMEEETITHTGSAVIAKDTLVMESGKDIDIKGSKAGGKKVEVKTGNNLSIESLQDSHTYHSRDKESGIHLQRDITARPDTGKKKMDDPYFSIGKKTDTTDSTYTSVTKQAGIYAGKEGYDIQVKNNTRLKGAVIDSQAEKEKNKLTTGTLTWENIDNKAEYKTGGHGISYNGKIGRGDKNDPLDSQTNNRYGKDTITGQRNGMNKITPTIYGSKIPLNERGLLNTPIPSVKGKAGTTTRSAVAKGTITITDKENQKQDISQLNRNTENSLNKLKEIFDKTKVEERKQLLEELGIVGNRAIHEIASHNGWKDGSAEKVALHGMLGAITSAKSGGSVLSGLIAGGANEYAIEYLKQTKGKDWINKHPDTVQNISAAFGGILSKMTGGSGHTGAYISQMGTKWNELEEIREVDNLNEAQDIMNENVNEEKEASRTSESDFMQEYPDLSNEIFKNHRGIADSAGQFISGSMGAEVAADLLRHALYGNGSPVSADSQLGQKISSDLNNSAILRAAIQSYGMKLKVGETKYIYGSVNLQVKDEYDNDATINEVLGYGRIKLGLQITRNENSIDYYGQASDAYNFEWHDVNSNLEKMKEDSSWDQFKKLIIDVINNGAAGYQEIGAIQAFDWSANLDGTIEIE
ncbi:hemagglutinin repeat-containing protein [Dialister invisus]|uniref:two-partner secretion domain-containing protein n=2 Tax=Dialister invisus TaxID=218538 RepID=UPI002E79A3EC|nr:hemagglutinin repeat-containing protein [Dialister invisus]MEE0504022.1 hemagglutinin repeat-containing protein [Dialister invisus]